MGAMPGVVDGSGEAFRGGDITRRRMCVDQVPEEPHTLDGAVHGTHDGFSAVQQLCHSFPVARGPEFDSYRTQRGCQVLVPADPVQHPVCPLRVADVCRSGCERLPELLSEIAEIRGATQVFHE